MRESSLSQRPSARKLIAARRSRKASRRRLLSFEKVEIRQLPSTFTVTSPLDDGSVGTLRWAVGQADAAANPSSIELELGTGAATIALTQGRLELSNPSDATAIYKGPGEGPVTISGNNASRVFQVDSGVTASISGVTIRDGVASGSGSAGSGGGLFNQGTLTPSDVTLSQNSASGTGNFFGGALYNLGTTTATDCTISSNTGVGVKSSGGTLT